MGTYSQDSPTNKNQVITIVDFIRQLRDTYGVPVNFIHSDEEVEINWSTPSEDMAAYFDAVVAQTNNYRWRMVAGRYVIYPSDPVWDSKVSGIAITDVARLDAATQYVTAVQSQIPVLEDIVAPPIKGDPRAPVYTELVSLYPKSSIVEHLVELLGANEQLVFTIERSLSGLRMLHFQQVVAK